MKRDRKKLSRGTALPMVALCLAVLMGFAGMGVDVGYFQYRQQAQQSATDAAALGAAQQLLYKGCPNQTAASAEAISDATTNGFNSTTNSNITVTPLNPPTSGPYANNNCAVQVTIQQSNQSAWFSRLFSPFSSGATETTSAVGVASFTGPGCLYLLNTTQQNDLTNLNIQSPKCGIYMNTAANMSNSTINAAAIDYAGMGSITNNVSGATFQKASPTVSLPIADPCPEIVGCENLASNPPTSSSCTSGSFTTNGNVNNTNIGATNGSSITCYGSLSISGTSQVCGLIAINGSGSAQLHMNNATVTTCSAGVTFYLGANVSDTNFSSSHLTLSPPTSGNYANMILYRVPSQSSAVDFSTCTCSWNGVVYFPTAKVDVSNVGSGYTVLIFGQANFSNSADFNDSLPLSGSYVGVAVLGQ